MFLQFTIQCIVDISPSCCNLFHRWYWQEGCLRHTGRVQILKYDWIKFVALSLLPSVLRENTDCAFSDISEAYFSAWCLIRAVVFVRAEPYFAAIFESGNIPLNRGPAWSAAAIVTLCSTRKLANISSAFVTWCVRLSWSCLAFEKSAKVGWLLLLAAYCLWRGLLTWTAQSFIPS